MKIEIKGKATFEFSSDDYCIGYEPQKDEYSLNYLIDRSEKGKDPDLGLPVVILSKQEVEQLFQAGFSKYY